MMLILMMMMRMLMMMMMWMMMMMITWRMTMMMLMTMKMVLRMVIGNPLNWGPHIYAPGQMFHRVHLSAYLFVPAARPTAHLRRC